VAVVVNEVAGNRSLTGHLLSRTAPADWRQLRRLVAAQAPTLSAPAPGLPGLCAVCRGPAAPRRGYCFQCELHFECAGGGLADLVMPIAYAPKGSPHARHLWQYKSTSLEGEPVSLAACALLALLLVFLREHSGCLWRSIGVRGPTHLAVVPTARRAGLHPLRALIAPYLARPWAELTARPDEHRVRELDPERFAALPVPGGRVLLVDDTWTTGASAQSAALALRRAGARSVVTVVIGRHLALRPDQRQSFEPAELPFGIERCAVHLGPAVGR
jgi:hypothetical protein